MGKMSRDKGSRFERHVAKAFSDRFKMNIRRVPLSGGLDIKSDLYCPEEDAFPYFVECKDRKNFRTDSLLSGKSELFDFLKTATTYAMNSYHCSKYGMCQCPIVVFKGGDFKCAYVLITDCFVNRFIAPSILCAVPKISVFGCTVLNFLSSMRVCQISLLKKNKRNRTKIINGQEDDGEI